MPQEEEKQIQHQQQDRQNQGDREQYDHTELDEEFQNSPQQGVSLYDDEEGMTPDGKPADQWTRPEEGDQANDM